VACLGRAAADLDTGQLRPHNQSDFDWPLQFRVVHALPMTAFVLLGVEAVIEALRAGWRRDTGLR
jgi:hypothetical protein